MISSWTPRPVSPVLGSVHLYWPRHGNTFGLFRKFKLSEQDHAFDSPSSNAGVINGGPCFLAGVLLEQLCSVRDTVPSPRRKFLAICRIERPCLRRSIT